MRRVTAHVRADASRVVEDAIARGAVRLVAPQGAAAFATMVVNAARRSFLIPPCGEAGYVIEAEDDAQLSAALAALRRTGRAPAADVAVVFEGSFRVPPSEHYDFVDHNPPPGTTRVEADPVAALFGAGRCEEALIVDAFPGMWDYVSHAGLNDENVRLGVARIARAGRRVNVAEACSLERTASSAFV